MREEMAHENGKHKLKKAGNVLGEKQKAVHEPFHVTPAFHSNIFSWRSLRGLPGFSFSSFSTLPQNKIVLQKQTNLEIYTIKFKIKDSLLLGSDQIKVGLSCYWGVFSCFFFFIYTFELLILLFSISCYVMYVIDYDIFAIWVKIYVKVLR